MILNTHNRFELHINASPDFTRKGWGKKVRAAGGTFRNVRGFTDVRIVFLPATEETCALAVDLVCAFPRQHSAGTVVLGRTVGRPTGSPSLYYTVNARRGRTPEEIRRSAGNVIAKAVAAMTRINVEHAERERLEASNRAAMRPIKLLAERDSLLERLAEVDRELSALVAVDRVG